MRTRIKTVLCGMLVFALFFGSSLAYLRAKDAKTNTFGIGHNEIGILEDFEPPEELGPGMNAYKKEVTIENTGTTDAFIRVFLDFSNIEAYQHSYVAISAPDTLPGELGVYTEGMTEEEKASTLASAEAAIEAAGYKAFDDFRTADGAGNGWVYVPETEGDELGGYFYYTDIVEPGEDTTALIHSILTFFAEAKDVTPYEVLVYAESVQVYDKDGNRFEDNEWRDAWEEFLNRR